MQFNGIFVTFPGLATVRILAITFATDIRLSCTLSCFKAKTKIYKFHEDPKTQFGWEEDQKRAQSWNTELGQQLMRKPLNEG